jgi:uncharacterized membrane protein YfcA
MFDLATETIALLALAAFLAGFIDSIAGGGGLIAVPALLLAGLSPVEALGTNKLQGLFGSGSATIAYASKSTCAGNCLRRFFPSAEALQARFWQRSCPASCCVSPCLSCLSLLRSISP